MRSGSRWRGGAAVAAVGALTFGAAATSHAAGAGRSPAARLARSLSVREEGKLHLIESVGAWLTDEGRATGTLPGKARVSFRYDGNPTVAARFTIYASGGTIAGRASGRLKNPNSPSPSFRGSLTITGGSGRYSRAHGTGELFGVFYRRRYGLTVQAIGTLRY